VSISLNFKEIYSFFTLFGWKS